MSFSFGQPVRTRCTATGRYIGSYGGEDLALYVSAMDNDLCIDLVNTDGQPRPGLPLPTDRELLAAGAGIGYGRRQAARLAADPGRAGQHTTEEG